MDENTRKYLLEHLRKEYELSFDRKDSLNRALNIQIFLFTISGTGIAYMLQNYPIINQSSILYYYSILLVITFFLIRSSYYFIKGMWGHTYSYIATPEQIVNYVDDLNQYNEKVDEEKKKNVETITTEMLIKLYAKSATKNIKSNELKGKLHNASIRMIIIANIFLIVSFIPYTFLKKSEKVQIIKLLNQERIMAEDEQQKPSTPAEPPSEDTRTKGTETQPVKLPKQPGTRETTESNYKGPRPFTGKKDK
ncbi:MAG: hypothetical protein ABUK01_15540 [Leptospirales bacterium]